MGRPKGSKNKSEEGSDAKEKEKAVSKAKKVTPKEQAAMEKKARESRKPTQALDKLGPGQRYFEAPDGTIIIGEKSVGRMPYKMKNEKTGKMENTFILPKR